MRSQAAKAAAVAAAMLVVAGACCVWYAELQGNTFVPIPSDGKPTCGTPITAPTSG